MKLFILFVMIFAHIVDDYYLQGILASLKQKTWWENQKSYKPMYKYDYIVALIMHAFSWSFMISLPILYLGFIKWIVVAIILNTIIHGIVDDLKANKGKINLIVDQSIHIVQIIITWVLLVAIK
jgi:hypothetical protein